MRSDLVNTLTLLLEKVCSATEFIAGVRYACNDPAHEVCRCTRARCSFLETIDGTVQGKGSPLITGRSFVATALPV